MSSCVSRTPAILVKVTASPLLSGQGYPMRRFSMSMLLIAGTAMCALAACGSTAAGNAKLSKSEIEAHASSALEKEIGLKPDKIGCPSGLRIADGEEMRCTLTHGG